MTLAEASERFEECLTEACDNPHDPDVWEALDDARRDVEIAYFEELLER